MVGFEAVGFTAQNELSARRAIGGRATERPLEVSPREPPRCSQPRLRFSAIYMVRDIACFAAPTCGRWRGQLRVKKRRTQSEHNESAVHLIADIGADIDF